MIGERRRFTAPGSDWGPAHLSLDAIVAFVDDELATGARGRATEHLAHCPECTREVIAQGQARAELRAADGPTLPSSLLSSLRAIPSDAELPPAPPGLAVNADGVLVSMSRPQPPGIPPMSAPTTTPSRRRGLLGAGAAMSGLALGALTFAGPLGPPTGPGEPAHLGRSPVGGAAPVLDARLQFTGHSGPTPTTTPVPAPAGEPAPGDSWR